MPLYDYRCPAGHRFEQLAPIATSARQDCPACGQASPKVPSRVSLGGHADPGPAMEQMPQTWRGTHEGNPEYLGQLRRQWNDRQKLEEKYDELRGDRRPVLAHEGRYHAAPLRAGDPPASSARPAAPTPAAADAGPATAAGPTAPRPVPRPDRVSRGADRAGR
jgi:putative FmdB family regulatory protein